MKQLSELRVVVLAAGTGKAWGRHSVRINGETLLERTSRLLRARQVTDIWVTAAHPGQHAMEKEFVNALGGNDLGCIVGCKELDGDVYLFGDVYYTEEAMDTILNGTTVYYGRQGSSKTKVSGEFFAFKPTPEFWEKLDECWGKFQRREWRRLWSWDLYRYHTGNVELGVNPKKPIDPVNWTDISDMTDDFDYEKDVPRWMAAHGGKND